ncbi:AAA family ATPase [Chryseobacterium sp. GP-SGM7]|uniref:AAA family ATPase n=1 Tax=Chryseobacterium sp. GP-SGM7 TaxID=3411323 RepID=UPI003B94A2EF
MIKQVQIKNFKSHKDSGGLELSNLTILCGNNSVGKSSFFQPLLLLREAYFSRKGFEYLDLLTDSVKIGNVRDALYENANDNTISFIIESEKKTYSFLFTIENEGELKNYINKDQTCVIPEIDTNEALFNQNFQYISSSRLEPKISYQRNDVIVEKMGQISEKDGKAEFAVHYLHIHQNDKVLEKLINPNYVGDTLLNQIIAWEREISENVIIETRDSGSLGFELIYTYEGNFVAGKSLSKSPINVGFGLSYTLPILVAVLSAKPGGLIIIENPEAHLHPKGIAKLSELLCNAAQAGIQIIIETHSDHIINGILVQCKKHENHSKEGISKENVLIYQFERDETSPSSIAHKIVIEEGGVIRFAPEGFFDQITTDTDFLFDL